MGCSKVPCVLLADSCRAVSDSLLSSVLQFAGRRFHANHSLNRFRRLKDFDRGCFKPSISRCIDAS
nr:MAG TPA: hypothetical protein [Caudoviricetes sp.]